MAMALLTGGRLSDLIKQVYQSDKGKLTDLEASTLIKSILNGLANIHENGVMHRDLKPANILLGDKNDLTSL